MGAELLNIFSTNEYDDYSLERTLNKLKEIESGSKYNMCKFEEDYWEIFCSQNNKIVKFDFTLIKEEFNKLIIFNSECNLKVFIKCWIVSNYDEYSLATINNSFKRLSIFFNQCVTLKAVDEEVLNDLLDEYSNYMKMNLTAAILNFSFYIEDLLIVEVISFFSKLDIKTINRARLLPSTKFLLVFHNKIYEFEKSLKKKSARVQILHYLIKIWWELSIFVPIRPIEVSRLEYKNISKENDKFYLKIKRNKLTKKRPKTTKVIIPPNLYKLIRKYYRDSREYGKSKTLFSYKALPIIGKKPQRLTEYFNSNNMEYALKKYLTLVFEDEEKDLYKKDLKLFTPIVTRHLAIINLIRQGYNSYEIAELAGHTTLLTQSHYTNHIKNLIDVDMISIFNSFKYGANGNVQNLTRVYSEHMVETIDPIIKHDLKIGYCVEPNMNCPVDECFDCKYWKLSSDDLQIYSDELAKHKNKKTEQIKEVLLEVISLFVQIQNYKSDIYIEKSVDDNLKRQAKRLQMLVLQYKDFNKIFKIEGEINGEE